MKKIFSLVTCALLLLTNQQIQAQLVVYRVSPQNTGGGNPGGINTDSDTLNRSSANGFTQILGPSQVFPLYSGKQTIPFNFRFAGQLVSEFVVSTSGILSFDTSRAGAFSSPVTGSFTSNLLPDKSVAVYWENAPATGTGANDVVTKKLYGSAPNRQLWIDWFSMATGTATDAYFSVVIEETTNKLYVVDKRFFSGTNITGAVGVKVNNTNYVEAFGSPNLGFTAGTPLPSDNYYYEISQQTYQTVIGQIGTGTTPNAAGGYPSVYGNNFWGAKHQFIIQKSELAAYTTKPLLSELGFYVVTPGQATGYNNFSISLKNTKADSLSTFQTGFQTVYTNSNLVIDTGWNNHVFNNLFQWDTTGNLLVEVCFNNNGFTANNTILQNTLMPFRSTMVFRADNGTVCNSLTPSFTNDVNQFLRPNVLLTGIEAFTDLLPPKVDSLSQVVSTCTPSSKTVTAKISDNTGVLNARLIYSLNNGTNWDTTGMTLNAGRYTGIIPAGTAGITIQYTVTAVDSFGNTLIPPTPLSYLDGGLTINLGPDQTIPAGATATLNPQVNKIRGLKITEMVLSRNALFANQLQTVFPPSFAAFTTSDEIMEVQNISNEPLDVSGFSMEWIATGGGPGGGAVYNATVPVGTVIPGGGFMYFVSGTASDTANRIFGMNSPNNGFQTASQAGFILRDSSANITDVLAVNGYAFNVTSGVTSAQWSGAIPSSNQRAGVQRINETNTASDWVITVANQIITSIGATNVGMNADFAAYSWTRSGSSVIFSTQRTVQVSPLTNTTYYLSASLNGCQVYDTIVVNVIDYCQVKTDSVPVFIQNVVFTGLNNSSSSSANGYHFYNTLSARVIPGSRNNILKVTPGFTNLTTPVHFKAWVDWNKDGDFIDQGEEILNAGPDTTTQISNLTIPSNASLGISRLRIGVFTTSGIGPCDTAAAGEFEDYPIEIHPASSDTSKPTLVSITSIVPQCNPVARSIQAVWSDNFTIDSVYLDYSLDNGNIYNSTVLTYHLNSNAWVGSLPAGVKGTKVLYATRAKDFSGNVQISSTRTFVDGEFLVFAGNDTTVPPSSGGFTRIAKLNRNGLKLSEILVSRAAPGAQTTWPAALPQGGNSDMVEIANTLNAPADLSGMILRVQVVFGGGGGGGGPQTLSYTFPAGSIVPPGQTAVAVYGNGTTNVANRVFYTNNNFGVFNANGQFGVALVNTDGSIQDAFLANNINPTAALGLNASDFSGTMAVGANVAGVQRHVLTDSDSPADWILSNGQPTTTSLLAYNTGVGIRPASFQWKNLGTSALLASTDTLVIGSPSSTQYEVTFTIDSNCTVKDTFNVSVSTSFLDLTVDSIALPTNCILGNNETVRVRVKNVGFSTLNMANDSLTVSLDVNGVITMVTKRNGTLALNDTTWFSFNGIDLTGAVVPVRYQMFASLSVNGDAVPSNNIKGPLNLFSEVITVNAGLDQTIAPGASTTLSASTSFEKIVISEVLQSRGNTGTQATFPPAINVGGGGGSPDVFEFTNVGPNPVSLTGFQFQALTNGGGPGGGTVINYTFPTGVSLEPDSIFTLIAGTGTNDTTGRYFFIGGGNNNPINSPTAVGYVLRKGTRVIDAFAVNNFSFPANSGVTTEDWSGSISVANLAGAQRFGLDNNTSANWRADSTNFLSTIGARNAGLLAIPGSTSWRVQGSSTSLGNTNSIQVSPAGTTSYVYTLNVNNCQYNDTVTVNVSTAFVDLTPDSIRLGNGACDNSNAADIDVRIRNIGLQPINAATNPITITATVGGTPTTVTINSGTIAPNTNSWFTVPAVSLTGMQVYTFNTQVGIRVSSNVDVNSTNDSLPAARVTKAPMGIRANNDTTIIPGGSINLNAASTLGSVVISEVYYASNSQGAQNAASFPSAITTPVGASFIEIANNSTATMNLSGWILESVANNPQAAFNFTLPSSAVLAPGQVMVISSQTGTADTLNKVYFLNLAANPYAANRAWGLILRQGTTIKDAVAFNTYVFGPTSGITAFDSRGSVNNIAGRAGMHRKGWDTNSSLDWSLSSANDTTTIGTFNNGLNKFNATYVWSVGGNPIGAGSSLSVNPTVNTTYTVSVTNGYCTAYDTVIVSMTSVRNIEMIAFNTPTNVPISGPTPISVKLRNIGNQAVTGFDLFLTEGGLMIATDNITSSIAVNGTFDHTFSTNWSPVLTGPLTLTAYHNLANDVNRGNDTITATYNSIVGVPIISADQFSIYPNPANEEVFVDAKILGTHRLTVLVRDLSGRTLMNLPLGEINNGLNRFPVQTNSLSNGLYIFEILSDNSAVMKTKIQILK